MDNGSIRMMMAALQPGGLKMAVKATTWTPMA